MSKARKFGGASRNSFNRDASESDDSDESVVQHAIEAIAKRGKRAAGDLNDELMTFSDNDDAEEPGEESDLEASDGDEDIASDVDLPDTKNWGSEARTYYHTDFVDKDFSTYNEKEEELAQQEEEEAKQIQLRLAKELRNYDFSLDDTNVSRAMSSELFAGAANELIENTTVKVELTNLTEREAYKLFLKDSPELVRLFNDILQFLKQSKRLLLPDLGDLRERNLRAIPALDFALMYRNVCNTYCSNMLFYFLLKLKRLSVRSHPVTKRLVQLTSLIQELTETFKTVCEPQLEALSLRLADGDTVAEILKLATDQMEDKPIITHANGRMNKNMQHEDDGEQYPTEYIENSAEALRRGITYQMANNKGLVTHRKKEQRNPRVKHRNKFRKALVRRKGAVRTVQKEVRRYGGEMFGIKAGVTKSVKFKS